MDNSDPEPQLIAAFAANNQTRQQTLNQLPLDSKIMAGIPMKDTAPIFLQNQGYGSTRNKCRRRGLPSSGNHRLCARSEYPETESPLERRHETIG